MRHDVSLSTDQLAALVEVARQGTLRAAAGALFITEQGVRNRLIALEAQLGVATQTSERLQRELASVREELAASRADQARHAAEDAAALAAAEQKAEAATRSAAAAVEQLTAAAARTDAATQPVEAESRAVAFEVMAQLEAEVEHRRALLTSEREAARDLERRLAAATADLDAARRQDAETRLQLDQARADAAQIERALIDKDRALEARDERIATLQAEIDEKLGALQKLNSMDLSLQGLESKMSDRLRRADTAVDQPNTPAFVCLTSDVPRQYPLNKKTMTVGRSSQCDIQIVTQFVSREHARLAVGPRGTVVIEDLGSTNGVFVNAARVERQELRHGDLVTVGETQFRFLESMAH